MQSFFGTDFKYALVGASNNPSKYGNIVFKDLTSAGLKVIPVNLKEKEIEGRKAYANLNDIKDKIDVVIFVVQPEVVVNILPQVKEKKITKVWMQPGSESENAIKFCKENNIDCVHKACIMVAKGNKKNR